MADYYPLLARALDAMPDRSPALRKAVYDRARGALIGQLRSLEPPLSEADINLESEALETAIRRLEDEHGGPPADIANDAAPPVFAAATAERDELPEAAAPSSDGPESGIAAQPGLPPAPEPDLGVPPSSRPERPFGDRSGSPEPEASPAVLPIRPRKAKAADRVADRMAARAAREAAKEASRDKAAGEPSTPDPAASLFVETIVGEASKAEGQAPAAPVAGPDTVSVSADGTGGRHRPRIDVVAPRSGQSRLLRNVFVGSILLIVVGLIAVAAFMLRDKPADLQPGNTEAQGEAADTSSSKYADRIGGETPPSVERRDQSRQAPAMPADGATKPPAQPEVAVAQRAVLFEENTAGGNAQPITYQGMVVWRLEAVNGEQGQPLETVIRSRVTFAEAGLSLLMTIRRNLDATLPASHTIELTFTTTSPAGDKRTVQDIGLLSAKEEEAGRGSPVSGLPVRVRENLFLIGLSSLPADVDRNTDLLEHRNWLDVPVKFASGPRGVLSFEKGTSGSQVIHSAFDQWRR